MTTFLRLLAESDKAAALQAVCHRARSGEADPRLFEVAPAAFDAVPGKPFAYWVSEAVRQTFRRLPPFESEGRTVKQGLATADDFRFVRGWWEVSPGGAAEKWFPFAKGGAYSPFYAEGSVFSVKITRKAYFFVGAGLPAIGRSNRLRALKSRPSMPRTRIRGPLPRQCRFSSSRGGGNHHDR